MDEDESLPRGGRLESLIVEEAKLLLSVRTKRLAVSLLLSTRWRRSFLLSLVFGLPIMALMIYMMVTDSREQNHGGSVPGHQNLLPGLSPLNLAFFLLCTPVQVSSEVSDALRTLNTPSNHRLKAIL